MNKPEKLVSAKNIAAILNVSPATVNYYTNIGLFKARGRKGNVRLYDEEETTGIFEQIRHLRGEGYSLRLIQQRFEKGYSV